MFSSKNIIMLPALQSTGEETARQLREIVCFYERETLLLMYTFQVTGFPWNKFEFDKEKER